MEPALFLGVDVGTSGVRAALVDRLDQVHALTRAPLPDHDELTAPAAWWHALESAVRDLPAELRQRTAGVAVDGTSGTVLRCHGDGTPCGPALRYNDARAAAEAARLDGVAPPGHVVRSASSSLAKLLWLDAHSACPQPHHLLHQADWLAFHLHGHRGVSDHHNALKLGFDVVNQEWPAWVQALSRTALPRVRVPGAELGGVLPEVADGLGLPRGCRVHAGTTDSIAAFLASGVTQPGEAVTSLGSTLVLKLLSRVRVEDAALGIYSHRLGDLWLVGGASNAGGAVLRQFFSDAQVAALSARLRPEQDTGLDYLPLPAPGERFPVNDPHLAPRLDPRPPDDARFLQGILEGLARVEAQGYRRLQDHGATPLTAVWTAGGGAANAAWSALRERFLGVPVRPSRHTEAAVGAALLARN